MSNNQENKILNEEERAILLNHDYDGIQEFNHPLPQWWVWTFVGGIVFAIFYVAYYQYMGGPSLRDEYKQEMNYVMELKKAAAEKAGGFSEEEYNAWVASNNGGVDAGMAVFNENCASCHKEGGLGDIGPNLTDKYWINIKEVKPANLFKVVHDGVEENGMPAWGEVLTKEDIMAAVTYVYSLRNTNAAGGKEPQGEPVE